MPTFQSNTHRAELSNTGILDVFPLEGRKIQETSFDGDDVRVVEHTAESGSPMLKHLLNAMDNLPVFRAAFANAEVFHVDYETGTQRWKGNKGTDDIREALTKCAFSNKNIDAMIDTCKQTNHKFLPKVG